MLPLLLVLVLAAPSCPFEAPVDGPVVRRFAPQGRFGGHWGTDLAVRRGTTVVAAGAGVVTFSGVVAGNRAVTVDHGGGVRTSYSYLTGAGVSAGQRVSRAQPIGWSGIDRGIPALHLSLRVGPRYVDPGPVLGCLDASPTAGLRLAPLPPRWAATP